MKIIEEKNYYKMSELVELTNLGNHTISFYDKKGLIPNSVSTSINMKYYPEITVTVLNLIVYFKENLNFSIDYIKELFDYYKVDFENRSELILQSIEMISSEIKNPISKEKLINKNLQEAINIGLLEDKEIYFKTEIEILEIFDELLKYDISLELVEEYINTSKKLALLEKELSQKVFDKTGTIPEILVLNIIYSIKLYIFNKQTLIELKCNK